MAATLTDYSQSGEQAAILGAVAGLGLDPGWFLDVGAGDGVTFSNTRALAEMGWRGALVEPAPWAFAKLTDLYWDDIQNGDIRAVCAVVTAERRGLVTYLYAKDDHLSTADPDHAAMWAHVPFLPVDAAAVTVHDLLDTLDRPFEVVSIDAEGLTAEILDAYVTHRAYEELRVLVVEHSPRRATLPGAGWRHVTSTPNNVVMCRA